LTSSQDDNDDDNSDLTKVKIPAVCPQDGCRDRIELGMINDTLHLLFSKYQAILESNGPDSGACYRQELEICCYLKTCIRSHTARKEAQDNNWPININFMTLLDRIVAMKTDLHNLIFTEGVLSDNLAQQHLNDDLEAEYKLGRARSLEKFSKEMRAPERIANNSHPG
jgi:hypothetical protein